MTSSNVIEYIIFDKELNEVGRHRQNIMCHTNNDGLEKFRPFSDFTILPVANIQRFLWKVSN